MSVGSLLRSSYLLYFSQPAAERAIYQAIQRHPIRTIVEIGIDLAGRTRRVLEIAGWQKPAHTLHYTAIDEFDARPKTHPPLLLKHAFAELRGPTVRLQLVPGDASSGLARVANSLARTDLLIVSNLFDRESLRNAWVWVPRMLTSSSLVFVEEANQKGGQAAWRRLTLADSEKLAKEAGQAKRHAA